MKKVIFSQVMTDNGTAEFAGVYDKNGLPVKVVLEVDDDGVVLTAVRRKLTDIELMEICNSSGGCENCIFQGDCDDESDEGKMSYNCGLRCRPQFYISRCSGRAIRFLLLEWIFIRLDRRKMFEFE